jgi:hypothetical protein
MKLIIIKVKNAYNYTSALQCLCDMVLKLVDNLTVERKTSCPASIHYTIKIDGEVEAKLHTFFTPELN